MEKECSRDIFRDMMNSDHILSIWKYIRFDDKSTRTKRKAADKFVAISDLCESVINSCGNWPHLHMYCVFKIRMSKVRH